MKKTLLLFYILTFTLFLQAQKDTTGAYYTTLKKAYIREIANPNINIFPVPVRENNFSIKTDREMLTVKVTNMIGQDIFKAQYKNPLLFSKVVLQSPIRGIYLVTISFVDGTRVVKKIMIENPQ